MVVAFVDASTALAYVRVLKASEFNPGAIISDAQMYDNDALTEAEIQAFLNAKITAEGGCTNTNCLAVYKQTTVNKPIKYADFPTGAIRCNAYTGGANEPAARIIFKIQQACSVSAKSILVTLQKEQGLITARAPSAAKLAKAMGAGCPDGAACDPAYANFQEQVFYGASLLHWYSIPGSRYYRAPGTYSIDYHPTDSCGSLRVAIANQATSALYRYTPYTPNTSALANMWSTGDACASYGNRNFWRNYNLWFNLKAELYAQVAALPAGTKSNLGTVVSEAGCVDTANVCSITYQTGVVTINLFPVGSSISVSYGAIGTAYRNLGGVTGSLGAVSAAVESIDAGAAGVGARQRFANGYIYELPSHATVVVLNAIQTVYAAQGGPAGVLGWPTAVQRCTVAGTCDQKFTNGIIIPNSVGTLVAVTGPIGVAFATAGGLTAPWGRPVDAATAVTAGENGSATKQKFVNGFAYDRSGTTSYLANSLVPAVTALGGEASLGFPTGATAASGTTAYQRFGSSWVFGTSGTATGRTLQDPLATAWSALGGATSYLGVMTAAVQSVSDGRGNSGSVATFTGGAIVSTPTGAFAYPNIIRTKFLAAGGVTGTLGWPTSNATLANYMWSQTFTGGTVKASTRPTVKLNQTNAHVKYLQTRLKATPGTGYTAAITSFFGPATLAAVKKFQAAKKIPVTGVVTTQMWDLLG